MRKGVLVSWIIWIRPEVNLEHWPSCVASLAKVFLPSMIQVIVVRFVPSLGALFN
jgi:hypothetical protein